MMNKILPVEGDYLQFSCGRSKQVGEYAMSFHLESLFPEIFAVVCTPDGF